jgi:hydrogenase maturation factor HypE
MMATVLSEKVTVDELRERLDLMTRDHLGISVDEFLLLCREHKINMASPVVSRMALLARLIDEASRDIG